LFLLIVTKADYERKRLQRKTENSAFYVNFEFKYDHVLQEVSVIAIVGFSQQDSKPIYYYITNNALTTQSTMRKIDIEFFNRFYKQSILESNPNLDASAIHSFIDIDKWPESLKSLVKMSRY